jgi:uncharacterized protein (DUF2062 family)
MWEYEKAIPRKTAYAKVWFCPDSSQEMRVIDVTTQTVRRRRVVDPIIAQLVQGVTPQKIALTIALGLMLGVFPILGSTTALCALAGVFLRLNQPIIQLVNYLGYPFQLALLIPFYRAGEHLLGRAPIPLSIPLLFERFSADVWQFLRDFGMVGVGGILVWLIIAPFGVALIYLLTFPPLRKLASRL